MTNFTQEIKRELLNQFPAKQCCRQAAMAALLETGGAIKPARVEFSSENERLSEYFVALSEHLNIPVIMDGAAYDPRSGKDRIRFFAEGSNAARAAEIAGISIEQFAASDCCSVSYLRGAFLGGGSCVLPRDGRTGGYHLEFVFSSAERAEDFCYLLDRLALWGRTVKRGEKHVVYLKSREAIADFLSVAGAKNALSEFESVSAARDESNFANRVGNCLAGNADRAITASAAQAVSLQKLKERGGFVLLSSELSELAVLRLENPTLSLSELAEKAGLTKSCINHRMRKLMQICTKAEELS